MQASGQIFVRYEGRFLSVPQDQSAHPDANPGGSTRNLNLFHSGHRKEVRRLYFGWNSQ